MNKTKLFILSIKINTSKSLRIENEGDNFLWG